MGKKTRGGERLGAGRKAKFAAGPISRYNVSLDDESAEGLRNYGEGDLSAGTRRAWRHVKSCKRRP